MIKKIVLLLIKIYQKTISPDHGFSQRLTSLGLATPLAINRVCRFYPTCSDYARESIEKFGIKKGVALSVKRILRCHPFTAGGYDPVEEK